MSFPGGLQLGGGVTAANAVRYLDAGASHVIVTSHVFRDGRLDEQRLEELVRRTCHQHTLLAAAVCDAPAASRRRSEHLQLPLRAC